MKQTTKVFYLNKSLFSLEVSDVRSADRSEFITQSALLLEQYIQDAGHVLGPASSAPPPTLNDEVIQKIKYKSLKKYIKKKSNKRS